MVEIDCRMGKGVMAAARKDGGVAEEQRSSGHAKSCVGLCRAGSGTGHDHDASILRGTMYWRPSRTLGAVAVEPLARAPALKNLFLL